MLGIIIFPAYLQIDLVHKLGHCTVHMILCKYAWDLA